MPLSDFLTGKQHHKAERVDSVYLSKLRIAKKKLLQESSVGGEAGREAEVTGNPANDDLIGSPEKKEVITIDDTSSKPAPDTSSLQVDADCHELEVDEHQTAEAGADDVEAEQQQDMLKENGEHEDDEDDHEVVSHLRKDSVMLARERLSGARGPAERMGKHDEEDEVDAEAEDVITEIVDDESVSRKRASMDSGGRHSSSWSQARPHSAMHNARHSADGSHSVHFGVKRTQSGGANRGQNAPRGDPRQRRASTGEGVPLDSSRRQPRKSDTSLMRFLKQAFMPASSSSPSSHHQQHAPAPAPSAFVNAASTSSHQAAGAPSPLQLQNSSGLASESSAEPAGCSVPEGGGSGGHFLTPPNTPSQPSGGSVVPAAASSSRKGGSESGANEDQGAVAAFFSKIGRATFKRRNSKELAQAADAPAEQH